MQILYQDDNIVAVNKPAGMLVHRTNIAADVTENFALQTVRDLLGQRVFPVHRIDRPTSGVLLFALSSEVAALLKKQFDSQSIYKTYTALVRGHIERSGIVNEPLKKENGAMQESVTEYRLLKHIELPIANERFQTTRYSLVEVTPKTGRMHQIRRHFAKIRHYLVGDTKYGDLKFNRSFTEFTGINGLMLHASSIQFDHPVTSDQISIDCALAERFQKLSQYH